MYRLTGRWNQVIQIECLATGETTTVWERRPVQDHWDHMYHLSVFGINLNYIDDHLRQMIPPTDS